MMPRNVPAHRNRRRARPLGQAMVEMALVAPILVLLLLGGSQVGQIAYSAVSIDTAAREGARAGVAAPNASLGWDSSGAPGVSHQCAPADFAQGTGNPICLAVLNGAGLLNQSAFTTNPCTSGQACVTIQVVAPGSLSKLVDPPTDARLAAAHTSPPAAGSSPCNNGKYATISGTVSGIPSGMTASLTDSSGDSQTGITGSYTLCATASNSATSQTLTATVGSGCGAFSGSIGPISVTKGNTYPNENITVAATQATISGMVSGIPSGQTATVTATTGESVSGVSGSYTLCVAAGTAGTSETLTATVGAVGCGGYAGSAGPISVFPGSSYAQNISVSANSFATVSGTVSGIPSGQSATVSDTSGDSVPSITSTYSLCVVAGGSTTTQTLTAQVGTPSCGGYSGSVGPFAVASGGAYTENFGVVAEPACGGGSGGGSGPGTTCPPEKVSDQNYVTVTVSYPVPIFVPLLGAIFQTQPGIRQITTSVTYAIEPCTMTQGA